MAELNGKIVERAGPCTVHFVNANKVAQASEDAGMREILWRGDYVLADGQPLLPLARLLGLDIPERIDGIGLMEKLLLLSNENAYRVFLFGSRSEILTQCIGILQQRYPRVTIAGSRNGYFTPAELPDIIRQINAAKPDILFIGIGSPLKEQLADRWKHDIDATIIQGVGGSFDVLAGRVRRAPVWIQRMGFEWLYRVFQEPRRMFWRYAKTNSQCLWIFSRALTTKRLRPRRASRGAAEL